MICYWPFVPFRVASPKPHMVDTPQVGWYFLDREGIVWGPYWSEAQARHRAQTEKALSQLVTTLDGERAAA